MKDEARLMTEAKYRQATVAAARAGDIVASREIIEEFIHSIDEETASAWKGRGSYLYARYLADCLQKALDEPRSAARALNLKGRSPGRRRGSMYNAIALGAAYWFLRRRNYKSERVVSSLSQAIGADRRTIQRAARAIIEPRKISDDDLKHLIQPYAEKLKSIVAAER